MEAKKLIISIFTRKETTSAPRIRRLLNNKQTSMLFSRQIHPECSRSQRKSTNNHQGGPSGPVYHIPCECGDSYKGETSRPLHHRLKKNSRPLSWKRHQIRISDHMQTNPDHSILWNKFSISEAYRTDYRIRKLLVVINIKRHNPPNEQRLRLSFTPCVSPLVFLYTIIIHQPNYLHTVCALGIPLAQQFFKCINSTRINISPFKTVVSFAW